MSEKIGMVAFYIFITGMLYMSMGLIYENRFLLLNTLQTAYFDIIAASLYNKIIFCVASITMTSFIVFILSFSSNEKSEVKNDK